MAAKDTRLEEIEVEEADGKNYLHLVSPELDGVVVDIALLGQIGSGRPNFVNALTGYVIKSMA